MLPKRMIKIVVYVIIGTLVFTTLFMGVGSLFTL